MPSEMEMQQALEERMKRLLEYASQSKVAEALGVTRTAVWRWAHGQAVTPGAVSRVQALLRPELGETYEEALPPAWAEGLAERVADSVVARISTLVGGQETPLVDQLEDRLIQLGLLPGEESPEESVEPPGSADITPRPSGSRASTE